MVFQNYVEPSYRVLTNVVKRIFILLGIGLMSLLLIEIGVIP